MTHVHLHVIEASAPVQSDLHGCTLCQRLCCKVQDTCALPLDVGDVHLWQKVPESSETSAACLDMSGTYLDHLAR